MSKAIHLGADKGLVIPSGVATQTIGILAKRGAGKSNAAAVLAEEMYDQSIPFIVIDPKGDWWGLRASRNGRGKGLEIPIFGGEHRDIPLEPAGGAELADVIAEQRLSAVIDVSLFSKGKRLAFLADFAERLYRKNRDPLHVFLEEADDYIPQRLREKGGSGARCLGAFEDLFQRGRTKGLGATLITQRSAVINKNVLTQCETLLVLRTTSPQDRAAIREWIDYQGGSREVLETLPELEDGEAWIWSPHWLRVTERIRVRLRRTYDSGATPTDIKKGRPAARLTDIDLESLQQRFTDSVERAKADDPAELRKRITELERELRRASKETPEPVRVEVPILQDDERVLIESANANIAEATEHLQTAAAALEKSRCEVAQVAKAVSARASRPSTPAHPRSSSPRTASPPRRSREGSPDSSTGAGEVPPDGDLDEPQRRIIDTIAMLNARGIEPTREVIARWMGIHPNGGRYGSNLAHLRRTGYLDGLRVTESATWLARIPETGVDGARLVLSDTQARLLDLCIEVAPATLTRIEAAERLGIHPNGGRYGSDIARLRILGLMVARGPLELTEALFR